MERYSEYKDSGIEELGKVPSHWRVGMLRSYLTIFSEKGYPNETLLSVTRELGVIKRNKESKEENHNFIPDDLSGYKLVHKGDFVINKMKSWQGSYGVSQHQGIVSPAYYTCKLDNVDREFFSRAIRSRAYIGFFASRSKGIRVGQWDLPVEALKQIPFIVPPLPEQKSIVAYLDTQTSRIDSFISDVECEIELLGEAKQKIIADAVTKGLKKDVEMVEANTILSNQIPKHWKIVRNRNLMESHYEPVDDRKDLTLLSLTLNGVIVRDLSEGKGKFPKEFDKYNVVYPNQIIFCLFDIDETPRTVGLCRNYGMITNAYDTLNIKNTVLPEYLEMYYLAVDNIKGLKPYYTGLRKTVQFNRFIQLRIGIPPLDEQKEIVDYISQKTSQIDTLISSLSQQITSLKEYKQRLISDVVTGQIKVC